MPRPVQRSVVMFEDGCKPHAPWDLVEPIKLRAHELFLRRGREDGHAVDDWLTAEQEFVYRPAAEMSESERDFVISLAAPDFVAKDLNIDLGSNAVVIKGRAGCKSGDRTENAPTTKLLFSEFRGKPLFRIFHFSFPINPKLVTASWDNGLLRIVAKKIDVPEQRVEGRRGDVSRLDFGAAIATHMLVGIEPAIPTPKEPQYA